jgi:DNA-3-methyladenine glycosylase II
MAIEPLDDLKLAQATQLLAQRDPDLAGVVQRYGVPPMWSRTPGFATLIRIILEQQVSLASALAAFNKLKLRLGVEGDPELSPRAVLALDDAELKTIGFSRQKAHYTRLLAEALDSGRLNLAALETMEDAEAHACLIELKGIGHWSADIYLLMALRRPDIWPRSDLALISAVARLKKLPALPTAQEFEAIGEAWRPYRSVAARLAWFEYLGGKP